MKAVQGNSEGEMISYNEPSIKRQFEEDDEDEDDTYLGEEYDDYHGEYFPKRDKRDAGEFLNGVMESGEKLMDVNIFGSVTTFAKTLLKPIFHYFIKSDNDEAMTRFTHRILPETGFKGSSNSMIILKAANLGDGEPVWSTIVDHSKTWNPRSVFRNDKLHQDPIHLQYRKIFLSSIRTW